MTQLDHITSYIHSQRQAMIDFLSELVTAESPSNTPSTQAQPLNTLSQALQAANYNVQHIPGHTRSGGCLVAWPATSENLPTQLLVGHCDTVWPIGTLTHMPFVVKDDTIHGPGVFDMKSGLTQIIFALKTIEALALPLAVTPVVLINTDEEIGSHESASHIEKLAKEANRAFVLEPSAAGKLKTARKGSAQYTVKITGKAAHAGLDPEKGVSAVLELSYVIQKLFAIQDLPNGISINVAPIQGGRASNVIADSAEAVVEMRGLTYEAMEAAEMKIRAIQPTLSGAKVEITGKINRGPMEKTAVSTVLWEQARTLGKTLGLTLEDVTVGGGSDGNITSLYTPTLDGLGAVGDGAHAPHEFIYINDMLERCALLTLLLLQPPLELTV